MNELHCKMLSISDNIPETNVETNRKSDILGKLPRDSSKLVRKRKEKGQTWKGLDDNLHMTTFPVLLYKQNEYSSIELRGTWS